MGGSFSSWVFAALVLILAVVGSVLYLSPDSRVSVREVQAAWPAAPFGGMEGVTVRVPNAARSGLGI